MVIYDSLNPTSKHYLANHWFVVFFCFGFLFYLLLICSFKFPLNGLSWFFIFEVSRDMEASGLMSVNIDLNGRGGNLLFNKIKNCYLTIGLSL